MISFNANDNSKAKRRLQIESKLKSNATLKSQLIENQYQQISAILIDDSKNTKKAATMHLQKTLGQKKTDLIPIILECCKEFIR